MLAARASTRRTVTQRVNSAARSFATVVDSAGIKVASVDNNQPTSSVTFLLKAGSRYETKPGVAHALKNFSFKSTANRSALGTVRESEIYGGVLSASLSREHLALTAEFLRGDEQYFVDVLSSILLTTRFARHEYNEYVLPTTHGEISSSTPSANPSFQAIEIAHALAFHNGLGSSIIAPPHFEHHVSHEDVRDFAKSIFGNRENLAVLGTGIDQGKLVGLVEKALSGLGGSAPASSSSSTSSKYFGGETRVQADSAHGHGGPQTVFIGFGTAGSPPPASLSVLSSYLSPTPSLKWTSGTSPIASALASSGVPASVKVVYLPYSDAALFGFLVQGANGEAVAKAGKIAVDALKSVSSGLKGDEWKKAVAKAKFAAASTLEGREGLVQILGGKVLAASGPSTAAAVEETIKALDRVDESAFAKTTSELVKAKPVFVAVGDVASLPYADALGL
ncbi:hypothetical protein D9757_012200 [Collybiopsis confluens]|uniref:Cytochrome b-c1 complex subunit 2, mitochondrial n=1 Tax=Collybiopsis confluens TaxID=2823264 RepID=A0A8H5CW60_9AGAR|nr:hypothetical protein D9757_012200 [Collybiopsis confluens]